MSQFVFLLVCLALCGCMSSALADESGCYTSGSVAGIVIATVFVTLVMGGLAAAFIWYLWKQRKVGYGDNKSLEKPIVCPPMSPDKQVIAKEPNDYAFDNPYFKDDDTDAMNADAAEKGQAGYRADNGDVATSQNAKASSNGTTGNHSHKKSRPFSSLPFHVVFHPSGKKQQRATMDDTYISKHLERITVPLRGHDFTGLGFNICGNMRDGIFVKDVLHRGPASESGKIKAGDRIVGVTVSFGAMVYEDALTILSYASPYDVKLEVEKTPPTMSGGPHLPSSSPKRLGTSTSFRSNGQRRLFHPLYRSQSIDDLTQIGKDGFGTMISSGSGRDSSSSATPKRSQSVEASNGGLKVRPAFMVKTDESTKSSSNKGSRKSSTSSCESTAKTTAPVEKTQCVPDEVSCIKKETVKSARFRVEQAYLMTEAPQKVIPPMKPTRDTPEDKQAIENDVTDKPVESVATPAADNLPSESSEHPISSTDVSSLPEMDADIEKPTAPPRKVNTPKRKAPAPPPIPASKTETSVVVHRTDDLPQQPEVAELGKLPSEADSSKIPSPSSDLSPVTDEPTPIEEDPSKCGEILPPATATMVSSSQVPTVSVFSSAEKIADPGIGSSDNSSLASADHASANMDKSDQNTSSGKRKASSLGDLTQLEHSSHKRTSTSSAILERAVSLDLQQSLPGENLTKQKRILHAPTFEDDNEEDNREDISTEMSGPGLKRWDNGLDNTFSNLPNGGAELDTHMTDAAEENISSKPSVEANHVDTMQELNSELLLDSTSDKPASSLENDIPIGELDFPTLQSSVTLLTSTPVKNVIEVKDITKNENDDSMDDIPYLASVRQQNRDDISSKNSSKTTSSSTTTIFSPVSISIPVIKPDLTHFEKLPSPPPASTHPGLEPSWRMTKTSDENGKTSLERISVQSLYRPIFSSKEINNIDNSLVETEKMVNGNESDASEHYSTAQENTSTSSVETSTLSVTLSNPVTNEVTVKAPSTIAGFAKTLIIPGPNEVENLLSLAAEPNTPPPTLEPPTKSVENE